MFSEAEIQKTREIIGKSILEIETPALLVDLDILNENIDKMNMFVTQHGIGIRPHAKTHKTPEIARLQMEKGALGITCAKVGEAEALAEGGITDILIANQVIGTGKIDRVVALSKKIDVKVAVDSAGNLKDISRRSALVGGNVGIVIEVEVGNNRSGVRSIEEVVELARLTANLPGVSFRGIMGYEGHCVFVKSLEDRTSQANKAYDVLLSARDALMRAGLAPEIVSTGGTGTYLLAGRRQGITDIQAGSYIFMDTRYKDIEGVDFKQSLTVLSTIVSHPEKDLYVCDAGLKSMTGEFGLVGILPSYGLRVLSMSEEHIRLGPGDAMAEVPPGWADLDNKYAKRAGGPLGVGDKIHLIPSHCCTTINLHEVMYAVRDGLVQDVWRITGRGRFA
ncbi:MAG TPA: DSD1 family PLP-dependent enzyme [Firmicutes bacterium]|nr:DSD1 family PLP-dependent enzyme [Candidatus Fermentithermobacillaceae bacterium]